MKQCAFSNDYNERDFIILGQAGGTYAFLFVNVFAQKMLSNKNQKYDKIPM
jgi:hypothetical protein